jgi:hypothetical protein
MVYDKKKKLNCLIFEQMCGTPDGYRKMISLIHASVNPTPYTPDPEPQDDIPNSRLGKP